MRIDHRRDETDSERDVIQGERSEEAIRGLVIIFGRIDAISVLRLLLRRSRTVAGGTETVAEEGASKNVRWKDEGLARKSATMSRSGTTNRQLKINVETQRESFDQK